MPYLTEERKQELKDGDELRTLGDLTYALTMACLRQPFSVWDQCLEQEINDWLDERPEKYQHYAEVLGCLLATQMEWQRRKSQPEAEEGGYTLAKYINHFYKERVAPYEDQKIRENGDVY